MAELVSHAVLEHAARAAFGSAVRVLAVEPLAGDASTRSYLRLHLRDGGAPATAVIMVLGEGRFAPGSDELGGGPIDELPFVNVARWLTARGLPVPAIHFDGGREDGLLVLEDVGDVSLWTAAARDPAAARTLFGTAVDLLVALQVAGMRDADPACYAFRRRFDRALATRELEHFVDHGIETRHGQPLRAVERAALLALLAPVLDPFDDDTVLAHRDFMAWNLHLQRGHLRLLDFQDALMAPDAYDLGALLTDRTTAELLPDAACDALIARFCGARVHAGFPVPGGERALKGRYQRCALHRALKVIGRFYFLERVRAKPGYLAYLPSVYRVATQLFDALPDLGPARAALLRYVPELAATPQGNAR